MNTPPVDPAPRTGWYHIRVKGHLAPRWSTRFDAMTLTPQDDGTTLIQGPVVDQAALHGLLQHVGDTGLPLLSVVQTALDQADLPPSGTAQHVPLIQGEPS